MLDKLKNNTRIASALFLTLAGLWAYFVFTEFDATAVESEGIYYVALSLRAMVKEQKRGQLPSKQESCNGRRLRGAFTLMIDLTSLGTAWLARFQTSRNALSCGARGGWVPPGEGITTRYSTI